MLAAVVLARVTAALALAVILTASALALGGPARADEPSVLLSFERLVTASSGTGADRVVDGDPYTRWESDWGVDPQWLHVDLGSVHVLDRVVLDWEWARASAYTVETSADGIDWDVAHTATEADPLLDGSSPDVYRGEVDLGGVEGRFVRFVGTARTTGYGYSLYAFDVYGTPAPTWEEIPAARATASSFIGANAPALAVDGDGATRWESEHGDDDQHLQIDLGGTATLREVVIDWEAAMASDYDVEVSLDGDTWTTVVQARSQSVAGEHILDFAAPSEARYVRIVGLGRTTGYGYSIWEVTARGYGFVPAEVPSVRSGGVPDVPPSDSPAAEPDDESVGDPESAAEPAGGAPSPSSPDPTPSVPAAVPVASETSAPSQTEGARAHLAATGPEHQLPATLSLLLVVTGALCVAAARRPL